MKFFNKQGGVGFTLVELLIVIALIGILAGAIVATLNPVEQVNKARDARYDNETSELLAGVERYYASLQKYPWQEMADDVQLEDIWGGISTMYGTGICGTADYALVNSDDNPAACSTDGKLIDANEVKPAFKNKAQFETDAEEGDLMYLYKEEGAGGSVYACFIPKSKTNRQNTTRLRCLDTDGSTGAPGSYTKIGTGGCTAPAGGASDPAWATGFGSTTNAIFFCVPE